MDEMMRPVRPRYASLPPGELGGRLGWGALPDTSDVGLVGTIMPESIVRAAELVRTGLRFSVDLPYGFFDPPLNPRRGLPQHEVINQSIGLDDKWDNLYPQASSQLDSLAHLGYTESTYYGGVSEAEIRDEHRNTVDHWARIGITGRGVLLDVPGAREAAGRGYVPGTTVDLTVADLEAAAEFGRVTIEPDDILLIRTGYAGWYSQQSRSVRDALPGNVEAAGLEHSEAMCEYLWDSGAVAIVSDTFAVESWPADRSAESQPFGFLHQMLIGGLGFALGELCWLEDVAAQCARTGVYEGMFVSNPSYAPGGIASTPNASIIF